MPLVYPRLRSIAKSLYRGTLEDTTLQPTAVVHEAYLQFHGPRKNFPLGGRLRDALAQTRNALIAKH